MNETQLYSMEAVDKDLMEMKVAELKEELAARDEPLSGNKAWLRRRLLWWIGGDGPVASGATCGC